MGKRLFLLLFFVPTVCLANKLPSLPVKTDTSPHKLFIYSDGYQSDNFDVWSIDTGYAYELFDSVDVYVGARVINSSTQNKSGFLSGVSYHLNDRVMVKSSVRSYKGYKGETTNGIRQEESSLAAEVSSRVKINDQLDIHATLDYQDWQQGIEVGLGFRF